MSVLALPLLGRALGAVPEEEQPPLLLGDVLSIARRVAVQPHLELQLVAVVHSTCTHPFNSTL
jgi:hypothetical protein